MFNFLSYSRSVRTPEKAYDFMRFRWVSLFFSLALIGTFLGTYIYRYHQKHGQAFNYSVEFTGGIQTLVEISKPVKSAELVHILEKNGWDGTQTREFSQNEYLIRVKKEASDISAEAENIRKTLQDNLGPDYVVKIKQIDSIGSATGTRLRASSLYAVLVSVIGISLYIAFRFFSLSFAAGAIISLFHDALAILTVFLLMDKEISINVIDAILVVLGYSINDTIVIFARIRDNLQIMPHVSMYDIINLSITETLSRTILTTFATLLGVVSLFIFGGETLRDLSFALLIGIVFGIYSTIFIATPVLLWLYPDKQKSVTTN